MNKLLCKKDIDLVGWLTFALKKGFIYKATLIKISSTEVQIIFHFNENFTHTECWTDAKLHSHFKGVKGDE